MRAVVLLLAGLGGCAYACNDGTVPPPGDPAKYDPVAAAPGVAQFAGDGAKLESMSAYQVKSDGTMDLTVDYTPVPYAEYRFSHQLDHAPDNAPPLGAGGSPDGRWFEDVTVRVWQPGQLRHVSGSGGDYDYVHRGMERTAGTPSGTPPTTTIDAPACSFATLWKAAIDRGAPANAVANVTYDQDGYRFVIPDTPVALQFGADCAVKEGS